MTDTIKSSALALITIINDILDFSKIEAGDFALDKVHLILAYCKIHLLCDLIGVAYHEIGKMKIESVPFNVRLATEDVLDCVSFLAEERGVELVCDVAGPHVVSRCGLFGFDKCF